MLQHCDNCPEESNQFHKGQLLIRNYELKDSIKFEPTEASVRIIKIVANLRKILS